MLADAFLRWQDLDELAQLFRDDAPPHADVAQFRCFGFVFGNAHFDATAFAANFFHLRGFIGDGGGMAIRFHEQQRFAIERQTDFGKILHAMNRRAIEKFQGAGNDLRGDDGRDGFGRLVHLRRTSRPCFLGGGFWDQPQQNFGDHAERSFGADENIFERIARDIFDAFVAGPQDFAVGQDDFQAHDVIAGYAVFQSAQTAGIFRDVAADGGNFHRAGIGRIE